MSASRKVLERKLIDFGSLSPRVAKEIVDNISKTHIIRLDPIEHTISDEVSVTTTTVHEISGDATIKLPDGIVAGSTTSDKFDDTSKLHAPLTDKEKFDEELGDLKDEDQSTVDADYDTDLDGEESQSQV